MSNPFQLRWLKGWSFQVVIIGGDVNIEAYGFGICLKTSLHPGESPQIAADRLVLYENQRRKALHMSWIRGQILKSKSIHNDKEETIKQMPMMITV